MQNLIPNEMHAKRVVTLRVATALRVAIERVWAERGGMVHLDSDDATEFVKLVAQMETLSATLERKART